LTTRFPIPAKQYLTLACALMAALSVAPANAAPSPQRARAPSQDILDDFPAWARQRMWVCLPLASAAGGVIWPGAEARCAWQNHLLMQTWRWSEGATRACISAQARWWHWAQAGLPANAARSVWDGRWTTQTLHMRVGEEQRMVLLRQVERGQWQAAEWRWNPNPRPATRRWQEERWLSLQEAYSQLRDGRANTAAPDAARMRTVLRRVLGARPGELRADGLWFESNGLCLFASDPLPGPPVLSLSYSPNDSRLEQRAAMHLQLSRQYPNAKWLTQFKMLEMPAEQPSGAKFVATWIEDRRVVGQLWMPAKGDGPTTRVRVSAGLTHGRDEGVMATLKVKQAVEHELKAIAIQWAATYE
jgi:hypothetical protein